MYRVFNKQLVTTNFYSNSLYGYKRIVKKKN